VRFSKSGAPLVPLVLLTEVNTTRIMQHMEGNPLATGTAIVPEQVPPGETRRDLCFWNLTVVHTNTGEQIKLERFSSRIEADFRRAELQELLASAHCTSRLVTIITQEGTRP